MQNTEILFQKYMPDYKKLIEYGFIKKGDEYIFEKIFKNNDFKAIIKVLKNGEVKGKIFDVENDDEFLPSRIKNMEGGFIGNINEEYKSILLQVRKNCFHERYFISNQANRICDLIIKKYNDFPEFMWEKFPNYGVFRNSNTNKWYSIIMNIEKSKLSKKDKAHVDIINIKLDKSEIAELLQKEGFYSAWHMNKKSWITIILDETHTDDFIFELIDKSYSFSCVK